MADFVNTDDIESGWRPLTSTEKIWAEQLIASASKWIRNRKPDLAEDDPDAQFVVIEVVRAALTAAKYAGHASYAKTVGGVTRSGTLVNPGRSLVFTEFHYQLLGISQVAAPKFTFGDCHE
ncbi:phage Gp19/Gp15/Gp42 family protein [Rhodococcus sp. 11-3]|uniref:phage Gp19/Gp15/Gp42 family protein n=1 Tax=Rhodococcus sp. 11-3 TaxID=2854796 RepID=UPI00203FFF4B|nr:phage Gp19/Gp15/Gp42 family protein [Rhodococcus sp. 11-3]USC16222.1 phage Gp19/Gp15/Gp42 family protein [Rhodococcus sp. 11-3]